MSEKRTTRARAAKEEAAANPQPPPPAETPSKTSTKGSLKRKRSSVPTKDPTPDANIPAEDVKPLQTVLPIRLVDGQPLPILPEPQAPDLSPKEYQSIIESGVLNAALTKSRQTWLSGCFFKVFYSKVTAPRKLKERTEEEKQAIARERTLKKTMTNLGRVNLVIEPHTFLVELWSNEPPVSVSKQRTAYSQYPAGQHTNSYSPYQPYQQSPMTQQYSKPPPPQPRPTQPPPPPKPAPQPSPAASSGSGQAPDPVIHMLAQRAGTDPELKAVMKIVAAGGASKEQLEFFQNHINQLTAILEARKAEEAKAAQIRAQQAKAAPPPKPAPAPTPQVHNIPAQAYQSGPSVAPQGPVPVSRPPPSPYTPYSGPVQSYHNSPYGPPPKAAVRPVFFSFEGGNEDRYFFPPFSILEWLPGGRKVKASFLITKSKPKAKDTPPSTPATATPNLPASGPDANPNTLTPMPTQPLATSATPTKPSRPQDSGLEKEDVKNIESYQPITVLISVEGLRHPNPHVLDYIRYAVHPPDVVTKYMNEVFDNCTPADEGYLALQLPREGFEEITTQVHGDSERVRRVSATPATPAIPAVDFALPEKKRGAGRPRKSIA